MRLFFLMITFFVATSFYSQKEIISQPTNINQQNNFDADIIPAANQFFKYYHYIKDKKLGLVVNHTSMVGDVHLIDDLLRRNCQVKKIFAPEHGFRGKADAGEKVKNGVDSKTGLPIVSLYGKNKKPNAESLKDLDLIIFDIQDVGARFYTYTSTMSYIMEACAENNIPLLVLDRPNPNGHYVDGPILKSDQKSFVGLHPVPVVHGLTTAEYARMINGEKWLKNGVQCQLYHVECLNYNHNKFYQLPIKPSPNLPNMQSIYLYPSLCLFEGTTASVGRGTTKQFQVIGHPKGKGDYTFKPVSRAGAKYPKHENKTCRGENLSIKSLKSLQVDAKFNLDYFLDFYKNLPSEEKSNFFLESNFFNLLSGNTDLQADIKKGKSSTAIRESWNKELLVYKQLRKKYLLYKDFE